MLYVIQIEIRLTESVMYIKGTVNLISSYTLIDYI